MRKYLALHIRTTEDLVEACAHFYSTISNLCDVVQLLTEDNLNICVQRLHTTFGENEVCNLMVNINGADDVEVSRVTEAMQRLVKLLGSRFEATVSEFEIGRDEWDADVKGRVASAMFEILFSTPGGYHNYYAVEGESSGLTEDEIKFVESYINERLVEPIVLKSEYDASGKIANTCYWCEKADLTSVVFLVRRDIEDVDFDEVEGMVVVATSKDEALDYASKTSWGDWKFNMSEVTVQVLGDSTGVVFVSRKDG